MRVKIESSLPSANDGDAYRVEEFCGRNRIGKTKFYEEVYAGRLKIFKVGRRTLVSRAAAENWIRQLEARALVAIGSKRTAT